MSRTLAAIVVASLASTSTGPAQDVLTSWRTLKGHDRLVRCLAYAPDGKLASGGQDRLINVWSPSGKLLHRVDLQPAGG